MSGFSLFTEAPAGMSYRLRDEGAYLCLRLAFYVPFPLMGKEPKDQGRHQGPTALGNRPSPMSAGPTRPTRSVFGVPIHGMLGSRLTAGMEEYVE